jgi:hypothetical protein
MSGVGANRLPILAQEIGIAHQACRRATADAVRHAIEVGRRLNEAKALVQHGAWEPWLSTNVPGISVRTAQRYMRAAVRAGKNDSVSFFRLRDLTKPMQERMGYLGDHRVLVLTPATIHGFTFLTVVNTRSWLAEGFMRPVRDGAIAMVLDAGWQSQMPAHWDCKRSRAHDENPWLTGAESAVTEEQAAQIDAIIAEADRRLDEFGYTGPRDFFAEAQP